MPVATTDKVLITNRAALRAKYGAKISRVDAALKRLVKADKRRGLETRVVDLSSAPTMRGFGTRALRAAVVDDYRANKRAIDAVFKHLDPGYLTIVGATDVIPHQDLRNPLFGPGPDDDEDEFAWSDLPYASEAPYSQAIRDFRAPTRVVGRLPDVVGATDPANLVAVLDTAASYQERGPDAYQRYFALTADVWSRSTRTSLQATFGSAAGLHRSPPEGPRWSAAHLAPLSHFVNCHGARLDQFFYGERGGSQPEALDAAGITKLSSGTVMSAECCYGAELFDPTKAAGYLGMCNTYMGLGAYAYFGSSTIAYGPEQGNELADLICQYFLQHVLQGASAGRATLAARLRYVRQAGTLTPTDLKTLAQFNLMADSSLTPVRVVAKSPLVRRKGAKALGDSAQDMKVAQLSERHDRVQRRVYLADEAASVKAVTPFAAEEVDEPRAKPKGAGTAQAVSQRAGLARGRLRTFAVEVPRQKRSLMKRKEIAPAQRIYVGLERVSSRDEKSAIVNLRGVEMIELDGVLKVRTFTSR